MPIHDAKQIVLVEDDARLSALVADFLRKNGYVVEVISDGDKAVSFLSTNSPDLLILDVMLPGMDGFEICKTIRPTYQGPIIFLTAKGSDFDQVLGLELGADDYVVKPVEPRVLLARVHALLRRSGQSDSGTNQDKNKERDEEKLVFGSLNIDRQARTVVLSNVLVELTSHEFDMLVVLAQKSGSILSRDYLSKVLLGREYDGVDRSVDVRVSRLRKKLGDSSESPTRIKTIWGKGYLFVADAWS